MSTFVNYTNNRHYTYTRNNIKYDINPCLLNSLFKTYGYCVDPGCKSNSVLSKQNIDNLRELAESNNDATLIITIDKLADKIQPLSNSNNIRNLITKERTSYNNLSRNISSTVCTLMNEILHIGLYLGGWNDKEPYITILNPKVDVIKIEFKIYPLLQEVINNINYQFIKDFPIINYVNNYPNYNYNNNLDSYLNYLLLGNFDNYLVIAEDLISTSYFYLTNICKINLPIIEPIIKKLQ